MISAILPVYNEETTIATVLDCLFASGISDLEIIVVDDASTDDTAAICRAYPVLLLRQTQNRGPAYCRNLGVARSQGDLLLFVDADIQFPPDLLSRMLKALDENPPLVGVLTLTSPEPLNAGFSPRFVALQDYLRYTAICQRGHRSWSYITTRFGLLRRSVFEEIGGFNESLLVAAYEDLEFCARMSETHQLALDATFLIQHHFPPTFWQMIKRLHVNVCGILCFDSKMRKKVASPFIQDRNARLFLGLSWLFAGFGFFFWPFWPAALLFHLAAAYQIYWLPVGFYRHEGLLFALKGWLTYNITLLPFVTGVVCGLAKKMRSLTTRQ
jgi:glycosyltransferase involved in cell wall biosynthesis